MHASRSTLFARAVLVVWWLCPIPVEAQQSSSPVPQAAPFLWRTNAVMSGGTRIKTGALAGNITLYGPTGNTSSTFSINADNGGQTQFNVSNGLSEYRTLSGGTPSGNAIGPGGVSYALSTQNPTPTSAWFLAAISIASRLVARDYAKAYVGRETKNGALVNHLQIWRQANGATSDVAAAVKSLTLEDVYLDDVSHLPVLVAFNLHPDSGSSSSVPVEVYFSNYQEVQNCPVAYHIQVYMSGSPFWDLQVSSASLTY